VMTMSVCVSVCLQRISLEPHARSFTKFFGHVAYVLGSVLPRVDDRPHHLLVEKGDRSA